MPSITPNLRLSITNRETNKPFLNWRLGIDGPDDSNMIKLDKAWGDMKTMVDGAMAAVGHAYTAATAADMTDHDKSYVYVGSETGYTKGNWYYWDEDQSAWVSGGVYNATALQTDDTLKLEGEAADAKATGEMIVINGDSSNGTRINITTTEEDIEIPTMDDVTDLKESINDISEVTRNLFDTNKLSATGITIQNGVVSGAASAFNTAFNAGIPLGITFDANTQYTWSLSAKNTGETTSGNGLSLRFKYTDNTVDANGINNNVTTKRNFSFTSAAGKTISALIITYSSAGSNTWELSDLQLEKGTVATDFIPNKSATDYLLRESEAILEDSTSKNTTDIENINESLFVGKELNLWEIGGINISTGENRASNTYARTSGNLPSDIKIITCSSDYQMGVYAYDRTSYIGYLDTTGSFTKTGTQYWTRKAEIAYLDSRYQYRIVAKRTDNGTITAINDVIDNTRFYEYRFKQTDAEKELFLIRKQIPSYFLALPDVIDSYQDTEYINQKINSIPDGKHFIFITDPHWKNNNTKNSTVLMEYVKRKMNIENVFQGGDILNQETSRFAAKAQMSLYMNEMKDAFGDEFICVQGNHDKNVANLAQVLEDNPGLTEGDVALPYDEIYESEMAHFAHRVHFDDWTTWLTQTGATGANLQQLDAYRKMHYYMDDDVQKIRYIVVCATNTNNNGVVKTYFGAASLNEACLQYEWFRDTMKSTPDGYDIVVLSHVIVNDKKDGTGTWLPYDQIGYYLRMMGGMATHTNVTIRNLVSTSSPEGALLDTFFASGNHTMIFNDVTTNHDIMFMLGGDDHCDVLCQHDKTTNNSSFISNGDSVSLSTGFVPAITTLCDARAVPSVNKDGIKETMTAGTITEQCFEVVTLTPDKQIVFTRFGAGADRTIQIT